MQYLDKQTLRGLFNKGTVFLISLILFTSLLISITGYSQDIKNNPINSTDFILDRVGYMQIHDEYIKERNPLFYYLNKSDKNLRDEDYIFLIDTATVHSISSSEKRHTYTYSNKGYRLSELVEIKDNNTWVNSILNECTYDDDGNKLTSIWKFWENNNWVNSSRQTNTYSAENYLLTALYEVWDDDVWKYDELDTYLYNVGGQVVSHIEQLWASGDWSNYAKDIYIYDDNGNMLTALGMLWQTGAWREDQQYSYSYNTNNNLINGLYQKWGDGLWVNVSKDTNSYNDANNKTYWLSQLWNDSVWVNSSTANYTYNDLDYLESMTTQAWQNNTWINSIFQTFSYGTYGGIETSITSIWVDTTWVNFSMNQYVYDDNGNALTGDYYFWEGSNWTQNHEDVLELCYNYCTKSNTYFGYSVEAHYMSMIVGINNNQAENSNLSVYPNPAVNRFNVQFNLKESSYCTLTLFDITGRNIKTIYQGKLNKGKQHFTVSTTGLVRGVCFLKLSLNKYVKTMKLEIYE